MIEKPQHRPRGPSPRGDFEQAKSFAITSEMARVQAAKRKSDALKEARLRKQLDEQLTAAR